MEKKHHLTEKERYQIEILVQAGEGVREIGRRLGRDGAVISRELSRNGSEGLYTAEEAHEKSQDRRKERRGPRKQTPAVMATIEEGLGQGWSPQQITEHEKVNGRPFVSHEWIYQAIGRDKRAGGELYRKLWCNKTGRKKRGRGMNWRDRLPNRVDISKRPKVINNRKRYGDWEVDLIEGKGAEDYIVSCVERKSRFTVVCKVPNKTADVVTSAQIRLLAPFKVRSITRDNGPEFTGHEHVNEALGCVSYFCAPYHSWERGLVENRNGLVRRYIPKGSSFRGIGRVRLDAIETTLNGRPHRVLGWRTPLDFLDKIIQG